VCGFITVFGQTQAASYSMKAALVLTLVAGAGAMELTKADWDDKTAGKSVFVKFQAPW